MWKRKELVTNRDFYVAAEQLLAKPDLKLTENLASDLSTAPEIQENGTCSNARRLYRFCDVYFPCCLSLNLWSVFTSVSPPVEDVVRENAITRIKSLLCWDPMGGRRHSLPFMFIQKIARDIVSFLAEEDISENWFECLADTVCHLAMQILTDYIPLSDDLRNYMSSKADTELKKSVYFLQNLPFPLDGETFVAPLLKNMFPAILISLEQKSAQDDGNWVEGFVGVFCLANRLMGTKRMDLTGNLVYQMVKSVKELVKSDMETELMDKGLQRVENVVRRDTDKYSDEQFEFVSDLLSKIDGINGVGFKTKGLVHRIRIEMEERRSEKFHPEWSSV